jgi:hypothetical protein
MTSKDTTLLDQVAINSREFMTATETVREQAEAWYEEHLKPYRDALDQAVFQARSAGHSVTDIARSYTVSGSKTPNRNAIYAILSSREEEADAHPPFEWVPRQVNTATGPRKVFDIHGGLSEFGPARVWGSFVWRYDTSTRELDPVLDPSSDPYPYENLFYKGVLDRWLANNPYPGKE